ncbi:phenylacetate--CoA ligase family protein [Clostridium sp. Cult3]|uniref:phenylacetate--CoA ligase family protein n=1 Tax=Clostridium sp. Cult3 TaxID=2079004 RepID=UPI001F4612C9|nr:hypothetical protein [Clostridium sp. Cult3]MCF6460851.1 hypothetical protein [Clostridium sp. Cult3]
MLGENIRKCGFWTLDFLRQGQIRKPYDDIKKIIGNEELGNKRTEEYLDNLLYHAVNTTNHYRKYKEYESLNDFPIITKKDIKNDYEGFLSNKYRMQDLISVKTSGSYGTPFTFYLTNEKKARQTAEIIYFSEWARYYVGTKHAYLRARVNKSRLKLIMQNEYYIYTRVIDDNWLKNARDIIKDKKVKVLIGFPTAISAVAQYCNEQGDVSEDFSIIGVITSSEPLLGSQRNVIESTFGCTCLSRYSTEELGVLAHECSTSKKHHINTASYKVEILDLNEDKPAKEGEVGRIVVTDLFSYAIPLIRYETGDLGVWGTECSCGLEGPIIESLHGRTIQSVYSTEGKKVLPYFIDEVMKDYSNVIQYQFIQDGRNNYRFKVCKIEGTDIEEEKIINGIKNWMGQDAIVKMELVDDIPTLPSGKRPYVINNYIPKKN